MTTVVLLAWSYQWILDRRDITYVCMHFATDICILLPEVPTMNVWVITDGGGSYVDNLIFKVLREGELTASGERSFHSGLWHCSWNSLRKQEFSRWFWHSSSCCHFLSGNRSLAGGSGTVVHVVTFSSTQD